MNKSNRIMTKMKIRRNQKKSAKKKNGKKAAKFDHIKITLNNSTISVINSLISSIKEPNLCIFQAVPNIPQSYNFK